MFETIWTRSKSILIFTEISWKWLVLFAFDLFYRPPTKLREGNVFTCVCHSVHAGVGGYAWSQVPLQGVGEYTQRKGGYAWEGWVNQGRIGYARGWVYQVYPCPPVYLVMATEVGGTHPTGMLSCFLCTIYLVKCWNDIPQATLLQCTQEVFCTSVLHDVVIVWKKHWFVSKLKSMAWHVALTAHIFWQVTILPKLAWKLDPKMVKLQN